MSLISLTVDRNVKLGFSLVNQGPQMRRPAEQLPVVTVLQAVLNHCTCLKDCFQHLVLVFVFLVCPSQISKIDFYCQLAHFKPVVALIIGTMHGRYKSLQFAV